MKICKVCFKNIENEIFINDLFNFNEHNLCYECFEKMDLIKKNVKVGKNKVFILMKYNDFIKDIIYKFKGLYDIELKPIFLEYFIDELLDRYAGYTLAYAPSFEEENRKRGFNHVKEMFDMLELNKIKCFYKKENIKQSSQSFEERKNIKNILGVKKDLLKNINKLLIVDDILTSGNTLDTCFELAKQAGVKKVKLLAICQTTFKRKKRRILANGIV